MSTEPRYENHRWVSVFSMTESPGMCISSDMRIPLTPSTAMSMTHKLHILTEQENQIPGGTAAGAAWVVQGMDIQVAQSVLSPLFVSQHLLFDSRATATSIALWTKGIHVCDHSL
jgi:hypothetical protein